MHQIADFLRKIEPYLKQMSSEPVVLTECIGRIISTNVTSRFSVPSKDISNVNGYAIKSEDITNIPTKLRLIGKSTHQQPFTGSIKNGQAVEVYAGCLVPDGADAIVPIDEVQADMKNITLKDFYPGGQNIIGKGIDIENGETLIHAGSLVSFRDVAKAAAVKLSWLPVVRQPRIGVMVAPEENLQDNQSIYLNHAKLQTVLSFINLLGGIPIDLGVAIDISAPIEDILTYKNEVKFAIQDMDMIIICGGTNNPHESLVWNSLSQFGAKIENFGVKYTNDEKLLMGALKNIPLIGMPSSFVAMLMSSILFLGPALLKMMGKSDGNFGFTRRLAILSRNLDIIDKKSDFLYGYTKEKDNGEMFVTPASGQDFLMLSALAKSDCIIFVDKTKPLTQNTTVEIIECAWSRFRT